MKSIKKEKKKSIKKLEGHKPRSSGSLSKIKPIEQCLTYHVSLDYDMGTDGVQRLITLRAVPEGSNKPAVFVSDEELDIYHKNTWWYQMFQGKLLKQYYLDRDVKIYNSIGLVTLLQNSILVGHVNDTASLKLFETLGLKTAKSSEAQR